MAVIIDHGSAFVTYEDKIQSKGVQVPAEFPLIKSVGAANRQSPAKPQDFVALYHRRTKIRMRSDEREGFLQLS